MLCLEERFENSLRSVVIELNIVPNVKDVMLLKL